MRILKVQMNGSAALPKTKSKTKSKTKRGGSKQVRKNPTSPKIGTTR